MKETLIYIIDIVKNLTLIYLMVTYFQKENRINALKRRVFELEVELKARNKRAFKIEKLYTSKPQAKKEYKRVLKERDIKYGR